VKEEDLKVRNEFFEKLNTDPEFPQQMRRNMDKMMPESFEKAKEGEYVKKEKSIPWYMKPWRWLYK